MVITGAGVDRFAAEWMSRLRSGRLVIQECAACGGAQHPPGPLCRSCWSTALSWRDAAPSGRVTAVTTVRSTPFPELEKELPYLVAQIRLDDGPFVIATIERPHEGVSVASGAAVAWSRQGTQRLGSLVFDVADPLPR